jgi:hypothetical protein
VAHEEWTASVVEVTVSGFFTSHHCLQTEEGVVGTLTTPFSGAAVLRMADGRELTARRTNLWRGVYELQSGGVVLATTSTPRGLFRRDIAIRFDGVATTLRPVSFWSRAWQLDDEMGTPLLKVEPRGFFQRGAFITILNPVDADLLAFAYYLVNERRQQEAAAAAAA